MKKYLAGLLTGLVVAGSLAVAAATPSDTGAVNAADRFKPVYASGVNEAGHPTGRLTYLYDREDKCWIWMGETHRSRPVGRHYCR